MSVELALPTLREPTSYLTGAPTGGLVDMRTAPNSGPHQPPAVEPQGLHLVEVSKTYASKSQTVIALDRVSATFAPGTFTAIMGPSGSGKSTLLTCAAGLLEATSGLITLAGSAISGASQRELTLLRRDHVGFVFQSFNLVPSLTAQQNVELPLRLAGARPDSSLARAALDRVGLGKRTGHRPEQLSGGEQQRVAIARAFVTKPQVLFADEPTGALDRTAGAKVLASFREAVDSGTCLICVTHDPSVAARADRVLYLLDGRLAGETGAETADTIAARLAALDSRVAGTGVPA